MAVQVPSIPQGGAEHPAPLQDAQALPLPRPLHVRSWKTSGTESPGPHPAGSAAPLPAQPFPAASHPPQRVRRGQARLFGRANPLRRDPLSSVQPLHPPQCGLGMASSSLAGSAARHGDGGSAGLKPGREPGLPEELGLWRGVGSWGALDVGYRSWQRACWSPASPDWKPLPADGCLAAGTERGPEAFQMTEVRKMGWGYPRSGGSKMHLCPHTAGDSSTAWPFPVPPNPPQMLGHPAGPPGASPKPVQLEGPQLCWPQTMHSCLSRQRTDKRAEEGRIGPQRIRRAREEGSVPSDRSHHAVSTGTPAPGAAGS